MKATAVVEAEDAIARLDERLRASPIREGWIARSHFADACASLWLEGELAHLEDLVLHDARMDARAPSAAVVRAHRVLVARRRIEAADPGWALSGAGLAVLRGGGIAGAAATQARAGENDQASEDEDFDETADLDPLAAELDALDAALARTNRALERRIPIDPEARDPLVYDLDWDEDERLADWRAKVDETASLPPVLAAAMALLAWDEIEPLRARWLGRQLTASLLRARGKTVRHLLCYSLGFRATPRERRQMSDPAARLAAFLEAARTAALEGLKEHDRLLLARSALESRLQGRRASSHLPQALEFVLARPIVTAEMIAHEIGVTPRAAQNLVSELGLREVTGRRRYRAWGIA